jgi:hypothetical protein
MTIRFGFRSICFGSGYGEMSFQRRAGMPLAFGLA